MPKCCVKGCGLKYSKKPPLISLHKLPQNKQLKKKWIEALGRDKIDSSQKNIFICSLHFDKSYINRTLDHVRLQDNAIPTMIPMEDDEQFFKTKEITLSSDTEDDMEDISDTSPKPDEPGPSTMTNPADYRAFERLKQKCIQQRKKIKQLQAQCSRQAKKLSVFNYIMQDLKKNGIL